jgi:MFS family permease
VQAASWHWIFLINVPIGIVGCIATFAYLPNYRTTAQAAFDYGGYLMIAVGMVAISVALDGLSEFGFRHATMLVLLVFGLASLCGYWLHAAQRESPLFSPRLFRVPTFSIGLLGNMFARLGSGAIPFLIPLTLQVGMSHTPLQAGVLMLPISIAALLMKRVVTPLIQHLGYRKVLAVNTILVGMSITTFALISPSQPAWARVLQLAVFGALNSLQFTAMNTVVLKDLDVTMASSGNTLLSMVQMLSMSFGVAASGALLAAFSDRSSTTPLEPLAAFHATFICVGLMTCASAWIFAQLARDTKSRASDKPATELAP